MKVIFKEITIQNLLSFGNSETRISFENGLSLITGPNGAGKSSALLDALSFALYDKPYRKINKSDLINRKNKKNLKVDVTFTINDTEYRIVRGMKNKSVDLEFYIDKKKQKLLSSKSLSQDEIENKLGVDYKLFKQIISLSINHNKPFLTLPAGEKRELLEKFVNIDILADMLKRVKEELKDLKIKMNLLINTIDTSAEFLKSEKVRITDLEKSKKTFESDKKSEIERINEAVKAKRAEVRTIKAEGKKLQAELKKYSDIEDVTALREEKDKLNKDASVFEYEISGANRMLKELKELDSYDVCPTCKSDLTGDHKDEEIAHQNSIIEKATAENGKLKVSIDDIVTRISSAESDNSSLRDIRFKIKTLKNDIMSIESSVSKLGEDKEKEESKEFLFNISDMKTTYNKKMTEHKANKVELQEVRLNISRHDKIALMLSDKGIKSYIFEKLIPILNKNVNDYLTLFELPIYIEFDNSMTDSIKSISNFNESVNYLSFSEGEKKKIDMAILLSFIDVTKKIANWNCNLLVIDELLDSSIDDIGLDRLLQSLDNMVDDSPELGVYIISHRFKQEYKHYFNKTIEISKNSDGFSTLTYL